MNKILKLVLLLFTFSAISCGDEEPNTGGGAVQFRLELNASGQDSQLNGVGNYKEFTKVRLASDRIGKSGLLVVNVGLDVNNALPILNAFDLCCPYEDRPDIKIETNNKLRAVCKGCKSEYDLLNGGRVLSGPAKRLLFTYRVFPENPFNGFFMVLN